MVHRAPSYPSQAHTSTKLRWARGSDCFIITSHGCAVCCGSHRHWTIDYCSGFVGKEHILDRQTATEFANSWSLPLVLSVKSNALFGSTRNWARRRSFPSTTSSRCWFSLSFTVFSFVDYLGFSFVHYICFFVLFLYYCLLLPCSFIDSEFNDTRTQACCYISSLSKQLTFLNKDWLLNHIWVSLKLNVMDLNRLSAVKNEHRRKEFKIRQKGMQRFGKSCLCESSSQTVIPNTQNV